jgi:hypothetical protein
MQHDEREPISPLGRLLKTKEIGAVMSSRLRVAALTALPLFLVPCVTAAQSVGPIEIIKPGGTVNQQLVLTPAQRSAIVNAVARDRVGASSDRVHAVIGAPVPPSVELREIPSETADDESTTSLKYATVGHAIVVVDPIEMRVVEVIADHHKP